VEDRQFEDAARYLPCLAMYMAIAWRVMHVLMFELEMPIIASTASGRWYLLPL
jgi:hypothetical protein